MRFGCSILTAIVVVGRRKTEKNIVLEAMHLDLFNGSFFFCPRSDLESVQLVRRSLLDLIAAGSNVLPLRPIYYVYMVRCKLERASFSNELSDIARLIYSYSVI